LIIVSGYELALLGVHYVSDNDIIEYKLNHCDNGRLDSLENKALSHFYKGPTYIKVNGDNHSLLMVMLYALRWCLIDYC